MPRAFIIQSAPMLLAGLLLMANSLAAKDALPTFDRVRIIDPPKAVANFSLTDHTGHPFEFDSLRGQPLMVAFGWTHCPDVCPTIMGRLKILMSAHADELNDVNVVMISVDGERDSPEAMRDFLGYYSPEFIGLTGDPLEVRKIAARFSAVFFKEAPRPGRDAYNVSHSIQVFALDRNGEIRAEFFNASIEAMAAVMSVLSDEG